MKKYILAGLLLSLLILVAVPILVRAETDNGNVTIDKIINALRADPALLQRLIQLLGLNNQPNPNAAWCYNFEKNIGVGASGEQVGALKTALLKEGFAVDKSGNFSEDTAAAVVRFQAKYGILQTGYVGPLTRGQLNKLYGCGITMPPKPIEHASVRVLSPNGGEVWPKGSNQTITWQTMSTILESTSIVPPASQTVNIYLQNVANTDRTYCPPCTLLPVNPCDMPCYSIDDGGHTNGSSYLIATNVPNTGSYNWPVGRVATYDTASPIPDGAYYIQVCLTRGSSEHEDQLCDRSDNYFKIGAGNTSGNLPPVISGVSGPTTLAVGQTGTWTVRASDPENGPLHYTVDWGDEGALTPYFAVPTTGAPVQQFTTFTHQYASAGSYQPTFGVTDSAALSARTSISVKVGPTTPSQITVLSPNGGEQWVANSVQAIRWVWMPAPTASYSEIPKVDLYLLPEPPACVYNNPACLVAIRAPIVLDRNISGNASYNWIVATDIINNPIPAGQYRVQVCLAGSTTNCDSSDQPFTIISIAV